MIESRDETQTFEAPTPKRKPGRPKKVQPVIDISGMKPVIERPVAQPSAAAAAAFGKELLPEAPSFIENVLPTALVLNEVVAERKAQDARWNEQNHPLTGSNTPGPRRATYEAAADNWKAVNDIRAKAGVIGWDGILLEEVYEALAESDPAKARVELVQVAAVAVAIIECIDRAVIV